MSKTRWWIPVVLATLCVAAYHNTLHVPFIFDDIDSVAENPAIRHLWPPWDAMASNTTALMGRPLAGLSLAINYALGGYNVVGYHLFNLALHFLNALLAFAVVRRALATRQSVEIDYQEATWLALAVTSLWLLHPLLTESVTYVLQRTETLMALFLLLALYCFIRGTDSAKRTVWFGSSIAACMVGMGVKEVMAVTPFLIFAYDCIFVSSSPRAALRSRPGFYAGLAASWIILAALQLTINLGWKSGLSVFSMGPWDYFKMECGVITHYLHLAVWPRGLVLDYSDWPQQPPLLAVLPNMALLLALFAGSVWAARRKQWWGFWGLWFFILLAPTSSFLPLPTEPAAERRMYLPLLALITVAVGGAHRLWWRRSRIWSESVVIIGLAFALGVATVKRNSQYQSAESIWADVVAKRPNNTRGHANLGMALLVEDRLPESISQFTEALRLNPNDPIARCNLAVALMESGATDQGIFQYEETLRRAPDYAAHVALGDILVARNELKSAAEHYAAALAIDPDDRATHFNLARVLDRMGQREGAITQYMEVLRLDPREVAAHYNLALDLASQGDLARATEQLREAARLSPNMPEVHNALAAVLEQQGLHEEAMHELATAHLLSLAPRPK